MKIRLKKLKELDNATHPNNIEVGFEKEGEMISDPKLGNRFWVGNSWRTSVVTEIIDDNTFKTLNSIYQITKLD
jgi:hypothetical protein